MLYLGTELEIAAVKTLIAIASVAVDQALGDFFTQSLQAWLWETHDKYLQAIGHIGPAGEAEGRGVELDGNQREVEQRVNLDYLSAQPAFGLNGAYPYAVFVA